MRLEDTLLAFRLPAHESKLRVRERKHPRLYWVDAGIVRALRRNLDVPAAEESGALSEGWVAGILRAQGDYSELFDGWFYWAPSDANKTEVDFLLPRGKEWLAIEVKSNDRVGPGALRAVAELPRLVRRILVNRSARAQKLQDGVEVWPIEKLHRALANDELWP